MRDARIVAVMALAALGAVAGVAQDVKTCLAQYEKDLAALAEERQATIKSLSEVYADNLESLLAQAKKDGGAALQEEAAGELDRVRKGEAVSGGEPPKHPDLKSARAKHEEALRLRDRGVARKIDDLTKVCDRSLEKFADSLAIRGRPDEATDARMARTTLNSRRPVTWARRLLAERGAVTPSAVPPEVPTPVAAPAAAQPEANVPAQAAARGGLYLVVDLSAGSDAKTYPVTYLDAAPAAGWGTSHKTDRLVLRRVEPGTFVMGSPETETGRRPDERRHSVTLTRAYYIGVFEVTQRQWELVMGENPSWFKSAGAVRPVEQVSYCMVRGAASGLNWPDDGAVDGDSFMGRLRARTGLTGFDLPTEAQWECACRAATEGALNSGKDLTGCDRCPNVEEVAVYRRNRDEADAAASPERGGTAAAGCRQPNRWGLYDMHGNVLEWCRDRFGPYEGDAVSDPVGAASGSTRVLRGGPWWYYDPQCAANCRSARRYDKNHRDGGKQFGWGFRAAVEEP